MFQDKLIHIDRTIQERLKDRQRSFLPRRIQTMAKRALEIPDIQETITNLGIEKALERAQRASDFPMIAAIAYLQGFPRLHAVRLVVAAARGYAKDPNFLDASGHRFNMDQLQRRARSAEAFNTYVGTLSRSPMERSIVEKSKNVLVWQRRYNRIRKFIFPPPNPSMTAT